MMLSAHSSVSEDSEKWRIFAHQPALNDLSSSSEDEQQPQLRNADADEENVLKRTKSLEKRVSFPSDQSKLVSHFIEPQADDSGNVAGIQINKTIRFMLFFQRLMIFFSAARMSSRRSHLSNISRYLYDILREKCDSTHRKYRRAA